jgi:hypothetical protein
MNFKAHLYISFFFSLSILSAQSGNSDEDLKWIRKAVLKPVGIMWKILNTIPSEQASKTALSIKFEQAYLDQDAPKAANLITQHCVTFDAFFDPEKKIPIKESSIVHRYKTSRCTPQDRQFLQQVTYLIPREVCQSSRLIQDILRLTAKKNI